MSSSDVRAFEELAARVALLEAGYGRLDRGLAEASYKLGADLSRLAEMVQGKDMSAELYGAPADHAADRAQRGRLVRALANAKGLPEDEAEKKADLAAIGRAMRDDPTRRREPPAAVQGDEVA